MATPTLHDYRAALYDYAGTIIAEQVRATTTTGSRLLDIGAGWGKYRWLLPEYEMDAVEIWQPYVEKHRLDAYYRQLFIVDAAGFNYPRRYAAVIMGDVLEHLTITGAQRMIQQACRNADHVYVATPFQMPQDEVDHNPHERHIQDDLTASAMAQRYPQLQLLCRRDKENEHTKAIYVKAGQ